MLKVETWLPAVLLLLASAGVSRSQPFESANIVSDFALDEPALVEPAPVEPLPDQSLPGFEGELVGYGFADTEIYSPDYGAEAYDVVEEASFNCATDMACGCEIDCGCGAMFCGPGLRSFARGLLGGVYLEDDHPPEQFSSFTGYGTETVRLGSVELLRQHVWSRNCDTTIAPGWRISIFDRYAAFDAGWLPLAELSPAIRDEVPRQGWFKSFRSANYFSYGLRFNYGSDALELYAEDLAGHAPFDNYYLHNWVDHLAIGPQIVFGRTSTRKRWTIDRSVRVMLGYGHAEMRQSNGFVNDLRYLHDEDPYFSLRSRDVHHHERDEDYFAQHVELRLVSSYSFSEHWTLDVVGRALLAGPWYQSGKQINLDSGSIDFGLGDSHYDYLGAIVANIGLTYLH